MIRPDNDNELINQLRSKNLLLCTDGDFLFYVDQEITSSGIPIKYISHRYTDSFKPRKFYWSRAESGVDIYILTLKDSM